MNGKPFILPARSFLKANRGKLASNVALFANAFLFLFKLILGLLSGSLAVISDAFHSLMDVIAAVTLSIGIRISHKEADRDHPFGHHRAEPIAALFVAVIAGILGFEILRESILKLFYGSSPIKGKLAIIALLITLILKGALTLFFKHLLKKDARPGIRALVIDSKNDMLATLVSLLGVILASLDMLYFDPLAGMILSIFIFKGGYEIGIENIDLLMGKKGAEAINQKIRERAHKEKGVLGTNTLRSHHVGNTLHVEIHIEVDHLMDTAHSHEISDRVEHAIENMPEVSKAFVHVDPVIIHPDGEKEFASFHEEYPHLD